MKLTHGVIFTLVTIAVAKATVVIFDPELGQHLQASNHIKDFYLSNYQMLSKNNFISENQIYKNKHNWKNKSNNIIFNFQNFSSKYKASKLSFQEHEIYNLISDYTFKLSSPCSTGTGWILDFEIPKNRRAYPKRWFFATNLHVLSYFFFESNPYNVELPIALSVTKQKQENDKQKQKKRKNIFANKRFEEHKKEIQSCKQAMSSGRSFLEIYKQLTTISTQKNLHLAKNFEDPNSQIKFAKINIDKPKLFYAPINFLGARFLKNGEKIENFDYYKDFVVIEIDFNTEREAKLATNNFYHKYYQQKQKNINIFTEELIVKNKTHKELENFKEAYVGGYPDTTRKNLEFEINKRKNIKTGELTTSMLASVPIIKGIEDYNLKNYHNQTIIGHLDLTKLDLSADINNFKWNNRLIFAWGYNYIFDNVFLKPGSSGSMVLDSNKNLLGLYRAWDEHKNIGFVEPLRSKGLINKGKIIVPEYDLINGTKNQKSSYKSQLDKYHPNMTTFLRTKEWK